MWPEILYKFELIDPWEEVTEESEAKHGEEELAKETTPGHPLHGRRVVALARGDGDDCLFFLPGGPAFLAVVHLTYHGPELGPRWPGTFLFTTIEQWERYAARGRTAIDDHDH